MKILRKKGEGSERLKNLVSGKDYVAKVGWFETAKYEDGTPVAYIAAIQEFGSPTNNIPSRSFMRTTIAEEKDNWMTLARSGAKAVLAGNETVRSVVEKIGMKAQGDIGKKITTIQTPPLKEATVNARRRRLATGNKPSKTIAKPLIDTGFMLRTLASAVEDK